LTLPHNLWTPRNDHLHIHSLGRLGVWFYNDWCASLNVHIQWSTLAWKQSSQVPTDAFRNQS
jgi:hypothetical protein